MKKYISPSGYFELHFPANWKYSQNDNLVSFFDEVNGVGTLQISGYLIDKEYSFDIKSELAEAVSGKLGKTVAEILPKISLLDNLAHYTFNKDDKCWEHYILFKNEKLFFITYNCCVTDNFLEKNIVDKILHSIRLY